MKQITSFELACARQRAYDGQTGPGDAVLLSDFIEQTFTHVREQAEEIDKLKSDRDRFAAALFLAWYDLHPTYGSTALGRGIGGQTISQGCSVVTPRTARQEKIKTEIDELLNSNQPIVWAAVAAWVEAESTRKQE